MLSVIIVTYNGMQWLERCLASVPKSYELVIVDNHSTDDTVAFIEENYPKAKLFKEKQNLGFGQANNKGIRYALNQGADYVYLLNQDAYLEANTIEKLIEICQQDHTFGILSPFHYTDGFKALDANFLMYLERYGVHQQIIMDANEDTLKNVYEIPFVNAAGWLLTRAVLKKVGGFDPIFFHYGEDRNYCQRVLYHQLKIGIVLGSAMIHDRENRKVEPIKQYSEKYYEEFTRYAKIEWGDINLADFESKFDRKLTYWKSLQRKAFLQFNFIKYKDFKRKLRLLKILYPQLQQSRLQNKKTYQSYL